MTTAVAMTTASLAGVDQKIQRAMAHTLGLEQQLAQYKRRKPFSVRVDRELVDGAPVGRLVALQNLHVGAPDLSLSLLAGEILYQLRSSLDHLVHQLVILSGNEALLKDSRKHQFPIFDTEARYRSRAPEKIAGVSPAITDRIGRQQPFVNRPDNPHNDPLWILQDLNNTDKHRLIPVAVVGIGGVEATGDRRRGAIFNLQSHDVVLKDGEVFFSFNWTVPDDRIDATMSCVVAFEQAMHPYGVTLPMDSLLYCIITRVKKIVEEFRPMFPESATYC